MCQQHYYTWCKPRPKPVHKKPCECCVKVENEIEIKQDIKDLKGGDGGNGGAGNVAAGGNGGVGGDATATQNASAVIQNYTIVNCGDDWIGNSGGKNFMLDIDQQKTELKIDENGDIFLNGEKMDAKDLGEGAKVFVFKNTKTSEETKKAE
jgi:hypothetical protein